MSMVVKNNIAAQMVLGELNKSNTQLKKSLEKVSTGQKIVGAKDDASGYSISEKMRVQIRSLAQDKQNVQKGSSLLKIADGAVNNIIEELRTLKELAINSANDTNTDEDRAIMQKEFSQKMANINDIATETNYNTKTLIDGTYRSAGKIASTTTITETVTHTVEDDPIEIITGDEVTNDGVYIITENFTGTINIQAQNVKLTQANSSTPLENVFINCSSTVEDANLWIEDLNIVNTQNQNVIRFQGSYNGNNVLTVKGNNTLKVESDGTTQFTYATINVGNGLTIEGESGASLTVSNITTDDAGYTTFGAAIGTNYGQGLNSDITIGGGFTLNATACSGAAIGSGAFNGGIENIIIGNNANVTAYSDIGDAIGKGDNGYLYGNIQVGNGVTISVTSNWGNGYTTNPISGNYPVGTGVEEPTLGSTTTTETITRTVTTYIDDPNASGSPMKFQTGSNANQSVNLFIEDMHTKSIGTGNLIDSTKDITEDGYFLVESDEDRYWALSYDKDRQAAWLATVTAAQNLTIDDIDVTTKSNANLAIRVLDGAIEYALDQATKIGAYLQKMEYTEANVSTMEENVQSAESVIRDADMAKEMIVYTKYNVLTQATQSMLAQANQNSSQVLSLLQ